LECSARRVTGADFPASDCSTYNVCTTTSDLKGAGNGRNLLAIVASQHYLVAVRVHARICPPWAFPP
jgi:hypothetical protein